MFRQGGRGRGEKMWRSDKGFKEYDERVDGTSRLIKINAVINNKISVEDRIT